MSFRLELVTCRADVPKGNSGVVNRKDSADFPCSSRIIIIIIISCLFSRSSVNRSYAQEFIIVYLSLPSSFHLFFLSPQLQVAVLFRCLSSSLTTLGQCDYYYEYFNIKWNDITNISCFSGDGSLNDSIDEIYFSSFRPPTASFSSMLSASRCMPLILC
jgi:hypothetical protein